MVKKKIYKIAKWCDGCGDCVDACPIEAIVEEGENVKFESEGGDESE